MAFRWRPNNGPKLNAGLFAFVFFQGIWTRIARNPILFVIFRGGGGGGEGPTLCPPSRSAHGSRKRSVLLLHSQERYKYENCNFHAIEHTFLAYKFKCIIMIRFSRRFLSLCYRYHHTRYELWFIKSLSRLFANKAQSGLCVITSYSIRYTCSIQYTSKTSRF